MTAPIRSLTRRDLLQRVAIAGAAATGLVLPGRALLAQGAPAPQWARVYGERLDGSAMGYAYAVARNGQVVDGAGVGLARSAAARQNASQPWTVETLCNLASVSKPITATAIMTVVQRRGPALLDEPFWPILARSGRFRVPVGAGVDSVTVRDLLTMRSGLVKDGTLYAGGGSVDAFLAEYLRQDLAGKPGVTYQYSNTNFTLLQVLYEVLTDGAPGSYAPSVHANVLAPMGITDAEVTATPRPATEALMYANREDTRPGYTWPAVPCVGPGGWLGTAGGMLKFLTGLRANAMLDPATTELMFTQKLGWYTAMTPYGPYYHHNGGLFSGREPAQETHTGIIHFPAGYDAVLLVNSAAPEVIRLMARAFTA